MKFSYYRRLTREQQRTYRASDEVGAIPLAGAAALQPLVVGIEAALAQDNQPRTQALAQQLADGINARLRVTPLGVVVLAVRPRNDWGELHGFYRPASGAQGAGIVLWMRTAQRRRAVAFRTFLRTLLHELCHHFDYELLGLPHSFHTRGFYRRESSLFRQLVPGARAPDRPGGA